MELSFGYGFSRQELDSGDRFSNGAGLENGSNDCTGDKKKVWPTKLSFGYVYQTRTGLRGDTKRFYQWYWAQERCQRKWVVE